MTRLIIVPDEVPENPYQAIDLRTMGLNKACVETGKLLGFSQGQQSILSLPSISVEELNKIFGYFIANEVISAAYVGVGETLQFTTRGGKTFSQYFLECLKAKEAGL